MMAEPAFLGHIDWGASRAEIALDQGLTAAGQLFFSRQSQGLQVICFGRICHWPGVSDETLQTSNQAELIAQSFTPELPFLPELAGDFALCIWDPEAGQLFLAKDHLGTRPLFYTIRENGLSFASDIASLRPQCNHPDALDTHRVACFLNARSDGNLTDTMFADISRVPPATVMRFDAIGTHSREYWRMEDTPKLRFKTDVEYYDLGRKILQQAVQQRVPRDQPIGVHISAGLDSSTIAAIAAQHCKDNALPAPIGVGWQPSAPLGETPVYDQELMAFCAETFGIKTQGAGIIPQDQQAFFALDPCESLCTQELVLEIGAQRVIAAENRTLMLSGWGGDQAISCAGRSWRRAIVPDAVHQLWTRLRYGRKNQRKGFIDAAFGNTKNTSAQTHGQFTRPSQIAMLRLGAVQERMDCWSMYFAAQTVQYAYPLLDRRLIEFALSVPGRLYHGAEMKRNLMRQIMRGLVPDRIRLRTDKDEPARFANSINANAAFAPELQRMLKAAKLSPQRTRILDIPKVEGALEEAVTNNGKIGGKLLRAVGFLLGSEGSEGK